MGCCDMKGFLSFLILWIVRKEAKTGSEITLELEERKGTRPSPGTIYPALKYLKEKGLLKMNDDKAYTLTKAGEKELEDAILYFFKTFNDIDEMKKCCKK